MIMVPSFAGGVLVDMIYFETKAILNPSVCGGDPIQVITNEDARWRNWYIRCDEENKALSNQLKNRSESSPAPSYP